MKQIVPKSTKTAVANPSPEDLENSFRAVIAPGAPEVKTQKVPPAAAKNNTKPTTKPPVKREGKTRLTVDVPDNLYQLLEKHKEENGQNFTFIIVSLLKKHFQSK